jgi:mono/diheme cytochrome c family protein
VLAAIWAIPCVVLPARVIAQDAKFHEAPSSSAQQKNPYEGQQTAVAAGAKLYAANCAACHGSNGQGAGTIPAVSQGATQSAPDGEIFWFITTGSVNNGMPAWGSLSEQKRWQIVAFLKSLKNSGGIGKISTMPSAH